MTTDLCIREQPTTFSTGVTERILGHVTLREQWGITWQLLSVYNADTLAAALHDVRDHIGAAFVATFALFIFF